MGTIAGEEIGRGVAGFLSTKRVGFFCGDRRKLY